MRPYLLKEVIVQLRPKSYVGVGPMKVGGRGCERYQDRKKQGAFERMKNKRRLGRQSLDAIQSGNMDKKPSRLMWTLYIAGNKGEKTTMRSVSALPQYCCFSPSHPQ